jgi:outer membrane lipoprotein-sorting protein
MLKFFSIIIFLIITFNANANNNDKIIENLKSTDSIDFNFEQNTNGKREKGNCTIEYPKKIFCQYSKSNNKILVSNGKSLVIKTKTSYYRYPLNKTPLNLILDKNYLISKIYNLTGRTIDNNLITYKILDNDNEISIFFNKKTYDLVGWQNIDLYQNFNITFISVIKKNRALPKDLFKIPIQN